MISKRRLWIKVLCISVLVLIGVAGVGVVIFRLAADTDSIPDRERIVAPADSRLRYPLILAHGFISVARLNKYARALTDKRCPTYASRVTPANTVAFRAKQLGEQVDRLLRETGAEKVNLIGHSMGGLDARYLVSALGFASKVATVTTVSTPHRRTPLADFYAAMDSPVLAFFLDVFGYLVIPYTSWKHIDSYAAVHDLSTAARVRFNETIIDAPGVRYESWSARKSTAMNPLLWFNVWLLEGTGEHDGIVHADAAIWGNFRGYLDADHIEQIGHKSILGGNTFDPEEFFFQRCLELAQAGY